MMARSASYASFSFSHTIAAPDSSRLCSDSFSAITYCSSHSHLHETTLFIKPSCGVNVSFGNVDQVELLVFAALKGVSVLMMPSTKQKVFSWNILGDLTFDACHIVSSHPVGCAYIYNPTSSDIVIQLISSKLATLCLNDSLCLQAATLAEFYINDGHIIGHQSNDRFVFNKVQNLSDKFFEKSSSVFVQSQSSAFVTSNDLSQLMDSASSTHLKRSRICFHSSEDALLQVMLIYLMPSTVIPLNRHTDKDESALILSGNGCYLFPDQVDQPRLLPMSAFSETSKNLSDDCNFVRIFKNTRHQYCPGNSGTLFIEATTGPFRPHCTIE